MSAPQTFAVEMMPPGALKPYIRNAKVHSNTQVAKLARAISRFGFDQPIVVDADNVIIKGHGRWLGSCKLNLKEVPVIRRTDLSDEEAAAIRILDNRLFEMGVVSKEDENAELARLVAAGTQGLDGFFDSMRQTTRNPATIKKAIEKVSDTRVLLNCPKCSHAYME